MAARPRPHSPHPARDPAACRSAGQLTERGNPPHALCCWPSGPVRGTAADQDRQIGVPGATRGSRVSMAIDGRKEPDRRPVAAALRPVKPAEPEGVARSGPLPARPPEGADRVRRPTDVLSAAFSLAVLAVVLGSIRALPLGSTKLADDVSGWLLHIPRWLALAAAAAAGIACFVLSVGRRSRRPRLARPARAAGPGLLAGPAGRRAQPRRPAARRDARRNAGARHGHARRRPPR
jgi:hypothetical protein